MHKLIELAIGSLAVIGAMKLHDDYKSNKNFKAAVNSLYQPRAGETTNLR